MCHPGHILRNKNDRQNNFVTVLNKYTSTILPKTLNYVQYSLLCVTQATYRAIKGITES